MQVCSWSWKWAEEEEEEEEEEEVINPMFYVKPSIVYARQTFDITWIGSQKILLNATYAPTLIPAFAARVKQGQ